MLVVFVSRSFHLQKTVSVYSLKYLPKNELTNIYWVEANKI
jgi:hypothetical protein